LALALHFGSWLAPPFLRSRGRGAVFCAPVTKVSGTSMSYLLASVLEPGEKIIRRFPDGLVP
jgi:hypothetical protein